VNQLSEDVGPNIVRLQRKRHFQILTANVNIKSYFQAVAEYVRVHGASAAAKKFNIPPAGWKISLSKNINSYFLHLH
jgi:hypothetical protein